MYILEYLRVKHLLIWAIVLNKNHSKIFGKLCDIIFFCYERTRKQTDIILSYCRTIKKVKIGRWLVVKSAVIHKVKSEVLIG